MQDFTETTAAQWVIQEFEKEQTSTRDQIRCRICMERNMVAWCRLQGRFKNSKWAHEQLIVKLLELLKQKEK
jgi:hypothetical protein